MEDRKNMNILIASYWDFPHPGGVCSHIVSLCGGLKKLDVNVDIIGGNGLWFLEKYGLIGHMERRYKSLANVVMEKLSKEKIDVINTEDVLITKGLSELGCSVPIVLTVHGYLRDEVISTGEISEDSREDDFLSNCEKEAYAYSKEIVCVDTRIKNYVNKYVDSEKLNVIYNFIDTGIYYQDDNIRKILRAQFGLKQSQKMILCPRRLTDKNGVLVLIKAFEQLKENDPENNFRLLIVGDGEQKEALKKYVTQNSIASVIFLNAVRNEEMPKYYNMSDLVCIPSITSKGVQEATSISCLEAMACKIPVIASNIGGLREIIKDSCNGFLVEENNPKALSDMIYKVLNSDNSIQIENAYDCILKKHSSVAAAMKFKDIYQNNIIGV